MGRPKKSAPAQLEPEDISQEAPEEEPARVLESLPEGAVSQTDAARAALDAGYDKPGPAVAYIKTKFGIDVSPTYFSAIKSRLNKGDARASFTDRPANRGPRPKASSTPAPKTPSVENYVAPPEKPKSAGEPDVLLALEGVKELVGQFGPERVKKMVDLLS